MEAVFRWRSDSTNLRRDIADTIAAFERLEQKLRSAKQLTQADIAQSGKQGLLAEGIQKDIQLLAKLESRLAAIRDLRARARFDADARLGQSFPDLRSQTGNANLGAILGIRKASSETDPQFVAREEYNLTKAIGDIRARIDALKDAAAQKYLAAVKEQAAIEERINAAYQNRPLLLRESQNVQSGQSIDQAQLGRLDEIQSRINQATSNIARLREAALSSVPAKTLERIEGEIERRTRQRLSAEKEIKRLKEEQVVLAKQAALTGDPDVGAQLVANRKALREQEELRDRADIRLEGPEGQLAAIEQYSGVVDNIAQQEAAIVGLEQERAGLLAGTLPGLAAQRDRYREIQKELEQIAAKRQDNLNNAGAQNALDQKELRLLREAREIREDIATTQTAVPQATGQVQTSRLTSLLIGAFDDINRRFVTTLQFALSGALIFSVQNVLRNFLESAFEVERTFADLRTALEFDIDAPRGTVEFEQQVQGIRGQTLGLAEEFNLLPQEVNKAAFVMISRFNDTENALLALRSQLLATKVSTIDQAEVLRALTAVSEAFANQIFDSSDALSVQEKLLRREAAVVSLYAKALDDAVLIQQRFGIEVEDTLEGTARAAEVFRQLGFSLEETESIIASVALQLGQTGQASSEKLVRSIGQLTSPQIREELLALAESTEGIFLTDSDFESGIKAWEAISKQFRNLEDVDPSAANELLQIVGQRREAEAVAAALGSLENQRAIQAALVGSAGAAQERFDVLARTTDEILKSIASGFDRLAQNIAELELVTPIRLALQAADGFLQIINDILEAINSLEQGFNRIFPLFGGLGTRGLQAFSLGVAGLSGLALARSGTEAFRTLRPTQSIARLGFVEGTAKLFTSLGAQTKAATGQMALFNTATTVSTASIYREIQARNFAALRESLPNSFSLVDRFKATRFGGGVDRTLRPVANRLTGGSVLALGAGALKAATGLGLLLVAIAGFADAAREAALWATNLEKSLTTTIRNVTEQLRQEGTDPASPEGLRAFAEAERETLIAAESLVPQGLFANLRNAYEQSYIGLFQNLFTDFDGLSQRFAREFANQNAGQNIADVLSISFGLVSDARARLIPGTRQYAEALTRDAEDELIRALIAEAGQVVGTAGTRDLAQRYQQAFAVLEELENPQNVSDERRGEIIELFLSLINDANFVIDEVQKGVELTIDGVRRRIQAGQRGVARGQLTQTGLRNVFLQEIEVLEAKAAELRFQGLDENDERLATVLDEIFSTEQAYVQSVVEEGQNLVEAAEQFGELDGLVANIDAITAEIAALRASGQLGSLPEALRRLAEAEQNLLYFYTDRAIEQARTAQQLADSTEENIAATQRVLEELRRARGEARAQGDVDRFGQLGDEIDRVAKELTDLYEDRAARLAAVRVRQSGPILNPILQAQAEVARLRSLLDDADKGSTEYLELQVQFSEAMASVAQAQFDQVAAFAIASAGVRNQIARLEINYALAVKELELIGELFGRTSVRFAEGELAIAEAEAALLDAQLSIEDINRRLGSDLTNSFEQAQLAIVEIARKLQIPGLGELEQAQLELELAQAELDAIAAFFNDRLFELRFDFETEAIDKDEYIAALERLLEEVDTSTTQGKQIFLQITSLINGLADDVSSLQFNIPDAIRLPTLFEVRRAVQAEQLGVNYQDNRQQDIRVLVSNEVDAENLVEYVINAVGGDVTTSASRLAPGGSRLTTGGLI